MVKAIVGANWGDEGKGKITDLLANESDLVIRFQGGANAGHTIINEHGRFALHLMPSGVCHENIVNIIGNGVAFDIQKFITELNDIKEKGLNPQILVSDRVQVIMPYHVLFDQLEEERLGGKAFGSTKSGIAPFYSDKFAKIGFQITELFDKDHLREKLARVLEIKNALIVNLYHKEAIDVDALTEEVYALGQQIKPYVTNTTVVIHDAIKAGKKILLEGQLGSMKDPDHGIYPMVTSSSTLAGYGAIGAGGHYGKLLKEVGGPDLPGVGFSFGVERLVSVLQDDDLLPDVSNHLDIYVMPMGEDAQRYCLNIANSLRMNGYYVDMCFDNAKMGAQFKRAEKKNANFAIIIGDNEIENDVVVIKNLKTTEQFTVETDELFNKLEELMDNHDECECGCSCHHHHDDDCCCEDDCCCCHDHDGHCCCEGKNCGNCGYDCGEMPCTKTGECPCGHDPKECECVKNGGCSCKMKEGN